MPSGGYCKIGDFWFKQNNNNNKTTVTKQNKTDNKATT